MNTDHHEFSVGVLVLATVIVTSGIGVREANAANSRQLPTLRAPSRVSLGVRFDVRVDNNTTHDFWFYGYRANEPTYVFSEWDGSEWQEIELGWCGTGLGEHQLEAGRGFTFQANAYLVWTPTGRFRVGLQLRRKRKSAPVTAWSEEIEIESR